MMQKQLWILRGFQTLWTGFLQNLTTQHILAYEWKLLIRELLPIKEAGTWNLYIVS